jgi:hypothetical protein
MDIGLVVSMTVCTTESFGVMSKDQLYLYKQRVAKPIGE